jgi:hypothetical protein
MSTHWPRRAGPLARTVDGGYRARMVESVKSNRIPSNPSVDPALPPPPPAPAAAPDLPRILDADTVPMGPTNLTTFSAAASAPSERPSGTFRVNPVSLPPGAVGAAGPPPSLLLTGIDRVIDYTARFEGAGAYDAWNPNDAGHGVSAGLVQFNQKQGSLPDVFKRMHGTNATRFNELMSTEAPLMLDSAWVRKADLNQPDRKERILSALREPQFNRAQREVARDVYYNPMEKVAGELKLTSTRAMAMLFDSAVQNGPTRTRALIRAAAKPGGTEMEILTRFAKAADANGAKPPRRTRLLNDPTLADPVPAKSPSA